MRPFSGRASALPPCFAAVFAGGFCVGGGSRCAPQASLIRAAFCPFVFTSRGSVTLSGFKGAKGSRREHARSHAKPQGHEHRMERKCPVVCKAARTFLAGCLYSLADHAAELGASTCELLFTGAWDSSTSLGRTTRLCSEGRGGFYSLGRY